MIFPRPLNDLMVQLLLQSFQIQTQCLSWSKITAMNYIKLLLLGLAFRWFVKDSVKFHDFPKTFSYFTKFQDFFRPGKMAFANSMTFPGFP